MSHPTFSVIIPAYNQADFLGEAIQSVLDQTFHAFEIIVVNDASPDHTSEVVRRFSDSRLKYIVHRENRGLPSARNTGIRACMGEIVAFLDADDLFHPQKLATHADFMERNPGIGVSYNGRYDLHYSSKEIRKLYIPPRAVELGDLVLGFPFAPSDMVIRKKWLFKVGLFDERSICGAEDIDLPCRLALEGCQFRGIMRALNYRRYHADKTWSNLRCRIEDATRVLSEIFSDPRCPEEVVGLKDTAIANHYEISSYPAFVQGEIDLAHEFMIKAVSLKSEMIRGEPCPYVSLLTNYASADESKNHEHILDFIFRNLPSEFASLREQRDWAIARGYLLKAVGALMWGSKKDGRAYFAQAIERGALIDKVYLNQLSYQLHNYEIELSSLASQDLLQDLLLYIDRIGGRASTRYIRGRYFMGSAFRHYQANEYAEAKKALRFGLQSDPSYLANRGVIAMFFHLIRKDRLIASDISD